MDIKEIAQKLKQSWRDPSMIVLLIILAIVGIIIVVQFLYMPVYWSIISTILFFCVVILSIYSNLKAIGLQSNYNNIKKQIEVVINNMEEGVIVYTPKFKILNINHSAEKILKIQSKNIIGRTISPENVKHENLQALTQVIFPSLAPTINQISEGGWPQITKIETNNPDLKLMTTLDRLIDKEGGASVFIKIIKDKTREEQLIETKNEFITTAAHQLRTPVTAMSWAFEQLHDTIEDPETKKITEEGKNLAARSSKIINDLLSVTQIEEGKYNQNFKSINIVDLIKKIAKEAKLIAKEYEIKIDTNLPQKNINIQADENKLVSALSAITENAILYNNNGGNVTLSVKEKNDKEVEISISDTGIGIPEKEMDKLFEKFFRGEKSSQISPNGSGLGLYISKNVIESHSGTINVSSTEGRGTTFTITLPINK